LSEQLDQAITNILAPDMTLLKEPVSINEGKQEQATIEATPDVRNFSYTLVDDKLYYRENSRMKPIKLNETAENRVKALLSIRDITREIIDMQLNECSNEELQKAQAELNTLYDRFNKKFGLINNKANRQAFADDVSYPLLCSLENLDERGELKSKADMFSKRTIKQSVRITAVDTPIEALAVSISEKAGVNIPFMADLLGGEKHISKMLEELKGVIFKDPLSDADNDLTGWQTADEYLSGNVREKLTLAKSLVEEYPQYQVNVDMLTKVQPKDLSAAEIDVRMGATWVDPEYYKQFLFELLGTPRYMQNYKIDIMYSKHTGEWNVKNKAEDRENPRAYATFGTKRKSAYQIFEDSLNLRDVRVFDTLIDDDGKEKRVLNGKETTLAQQKQEAICEAFKDWIWKDPQRREVLAKKYNTLYNSIRPREFDGQHIKFDGMNPLIKLNTHQSNAVARTLYGGNALLAHVVGAGKTFTMIASAMEGKRLGLQQKSLFVVPNHLTEQMGSDSHILYPGANVLVATKKDFEPANRKKFCSRIATGDFDIVVIGHSQFEKIPLSVARQEEILKTQVEEILLAIQDARAQNSERYTVKQLEKTKKSLETRLEKLGSQERKDSVVTFEELGVDKLYVDEAHLFKNLFLQTKMRNVAGIGQSEAQKSTDMFTKCRYMDELTGGKGTVFATGTPVSNSMTELYTMMRYLQYGTLQQMDLIHFDSWAATFGEKVTAIELAPEGTGFRSKTRFAKFFNLPELINIWKEAADIQTADMLNLPVPEAIHTTVVTKPSEFQRDMVKDLADRADVVRKKLVEPNVDNMLKITSDGRKLALDQRLQNDMLNDDPDSKINVCVKNVYDIWEESTATKGAQLIFCDLSTPHYDGTFNVYDDIKNKLMEKGVPPEEIKYIHDANTEQQKAELFARVRSGEVRVLIGSTGKMGAGTNVQKKLVALHHTDCPWRPADLEQREGRIVRQGNENKQVKIFKYVTENTFDAYNWSLIENKQKFIGQIFTSKSPARSADDIDATALSYAEVKALATGDERIKEKMDLDIQVAKLKLMRSNHQSQKYEMEDRLIKY
ncbi:MAG: DEAD/DEAH box helicase family protein, partial [Epulopiscium sp.]|nr:DEAD/DEAH box helicase family protein [Candidatus Epulonipiscium sp.]